jgi:hypothetical protein
MGSRPDVAVLLGVGDFCAGQRPEPWVGIMRVGRRSVDQQLGNGAGERGLRAGIGMVRLSRERVDAGLRDLHRDGSPAQGSGRVAGKVSSSCMGMLRIRGGAPERSASWLVGETVISAGMSA